MSPADLSKSAGKMTLYEFDPLEDFRWARFSERHPNASVFHSQAWLRALHNAYGYQLIALSTTPPENELDNGIVFCFIRSRLTGDRLVSLPFSDHCEPLLDDQTHLDWLLSRLKDARRRETRYIEIRPMTSRLAGPPGFSEAGEFRLHRIRLASSADSMFRCFSKNIRRNIRRAERYLLRYETGTSEKLLDHFCVLQALTRKRHLLPPQPLIWFRSLVNCMGSRIAIRVAYMNDTPVAGILTLRHTGVMVYKYGGYDTRYRDCGGMAFLLWRTIQEACHDGLREFDLGRSDCGDAGLIRFKDGWGGAGSTIRYWSCGGHRFGGTASRRMARWMRHAVPYLPDRLVAAAGGLLYRHVG